MRAREEVLCAHRAGLTHVDPLYATSVLNPQSWQKSRISSWKSP